MRAFRQRFAPRSEALPRSFTTSPATPRSLQSPINARCPPPHGCGKHLTARGISARDASPQAQAARRIGGFADLDGIEFVARIDVGDDTNGEAKNEIRSAVTPDHRDYAQLMGGVPAGALPAPAAGVPHAPSAPRPQAPAGAPVRPAWAQ